MPPVASRVPFVGKSYHLMVPVVAVAVNEILPVPHLAAGVVAVNEGVEFTVAVTETLVDVQEPTTDST